MVQYVLARVVCPCGRAPGDVLLHIWAHARIACPSERAPGLSLPLCCVFRSAVWMRFFLPQSQQCHWARALHGGVSAQGEPPVSATATCEETGARPFCVASKVVEIGAASYAKSQSHDCDMIIVRFCPTQ